MTQISSNNWWARRAIGRTKAMREVPFSVLRALVLLGGTGTVEQISSTMAITAEETLHRLATWITFGAVARRGDRYRLIPEGRDPGPPRRSRRRRDPNLYGRKR